MEFTCNLPVRKAPVDSCVLILTCTKPFNRSSGIMIARKMGAAYAIVTTVESSDVIAMSHSWTSSGNARSAVSISVLK